MNAPSKFHVALTADFYQVDGSLKYRDIGLDRLQSDPRIVVTPFGRHHSEISPDQLSGVHGVIVLTPKVTAASLQGNSCLLAVGRFGVGFDSVDVAACTAADVALFITAGAVDHSVAEATVGWMLALTHHMRIKDQLVRTGAWDDRSRYMGCELRDRTLGLVGFGGIGRCLVRLLQGFGMKSPLVYDPYIGKDAAASLGVRLVGLDQLMSESDFVSLHCPLNDTTRGLIGDRELRMMKTSAYFLNTARGGIVDEVALFAALQERRIAGAALDCFADEPIRERSCWSDLDNVLLAPHSIAWTDELFRDIGRSVCNGMISLSRGQRPHGLVNAEVLERPGFQQKLAIWQS